MFLPLSSSLNGFLWKTAVIQIIFPMGNVSFFSFCFVLVFRRLMTICLAVRIYLKYTVWDSLVSRLFRFMSLVKFGYSLVITFSHFGHFSVLIFHLVILLYLLYLCWDVLLFIFCKHIYNFSLKNFYNRFFKNFFFLYLFLLKHLLNAFSHSSWDFPGSWHDEWLSIISWTFWNLCYKTLDFI